MWFTQGVCTGRTQAAVQVHMVVLVHVFEHDMPEMYYDEDGNELMSRTKAMNTKLKWPSGWFEGRGILEEVRRKRTRGKSLSQIKQNLELEIEERLLLEDDDGRGRLVPLLMEPLGADLFVYRKKAEEGLVGVGTDEDHVDGDYGSHTDDESDANETQDQDSGLDTPGREADDIGDTSGDQSSAMVSEPESNDDNETEADLEVGLHRVSSISLIRNSLIPPSLASHAFEITLAELYGPLPCPNNNSPSSYTLSNLGTNAHDIPDELTNRIPPTMRPHAHKSITFPLQELAEACLLHGGEMRERRATDRARGIVGHAWTEVEQELINQRKEAARVKAAAARSARREQRRKLHEVDGDEEGENEVDGEIQGAGDGRKVMAVKRVKRGGGDNETSGYLSE